jgi:hypothetical protein
MSTTYEDPFASAWSKARFPDENRAFVKSFREEIGIAGFEYVAADYRYIAATRRDGTGELRIHWGCTTVFTEAEAQPFRGRADEIRASSTRKTTWLVSHPEHRDVSLRGPAGDSSTPTPQRCPQCHSYELSAIGVCPGCDDE